MVELNLNVWILLRLFVTHEHSVKNKNYWIYIFLYQSIPFFIVFSFLFNRLKTILSWFNSIQSFIHSFVTCFSLSNITQHWYSCIFLLIEGKEPSNLLKVLFFILSFLLDYLFHRHPNIVFLRLDQYLHRFISKTLYIFPYQQNPYCSTL